MLGNNWDRIFGQEYIKRNLFKSSPTKQLTRKAVTWVKASSGRDQTEVKIINFGDRLGRHEGILFYIGIADNSFSNSNVIIAGITYMKAY